MFLPTFKNFIFLKEKQLRNRSSLFSLLLCSCILCLSLTISILHLNLLAQKVAIRHFFLRIFSEQMRSSLNFSEYVKKCLLLSCVIFCPIPEADIHLLKSRLFDYLVLTTHENSLLVILEFKWPCSQVSVSHGNHPKHQAQK